MQRSSPSVSAKVKASGPKIDKNYFPEKFIHAIFGYLNSILLLDPQYFVKLSQSEKHADQNARLVIRHFGLTNDLFLKTPTFFQEHIDPSASKELEPEGARLFKSTYESISFEKFEGELESILNKIKHARLSYENVQDINKLAKKLFKELKTFNTSEGQSLWNNFCKRANIIDEKSLSEENKTFLQNRLAAGLMRFIIEKYSAKKSQALQEFQKKSGNIDTDDAKFDALYAKAYKLVENIKLVQMVLTKEIYSQSDFTQYLNSKAEKHLFKICQPIYNLGDYLPLANLNGAKDEEKKDITAKAAHYCSLLTSALTSIKNNEEILALGHSQIINLIMIEKLKEALQFLFAGIHVTDHAFHRKQVQEIANCICIYLEETYCSFISSLKNEWLIDTYFNQAIKILISGDKAKTKLGAPVIKLIKELQSLLILISKVCRTEEGYILTQAEQVNVNRLLKLKRAFNQIELNVQYEGSLKEDGMNVVINIPANRANLRHASLVSHMLSSADKNVKDSEVAAFNHPIDLVQKGSALLYAAPETKNTAAPERLKEEKRDPEKRLSRGPSFGNLFASRKKDSRSPTPSSSVARSVSPREAVEEERRVAQPSPKRSFFNLLLSNEKDKPSSPPPDSEHSEKAYSPIRGAPSQELGAQPSPDRGGQSPKESRQALDRHESSPSRLMPKLPKIGSGEKKPQAPSSAPTSIIERTNADAGTSRIGRRNNDNQSSPSQSPSPMKR